jgi:hypothetical protein
LKTVQSIGFTPVAEVNGDLVNGETPFLLRGRKGIFARLMGVGCVRIDGYFLLLSFDSSTMVALSSYTPAITT